jgi:RNA polymerase sigma factor (sigma-70 family)
MSNEGIAGSSKPEDRNAEVRAEVLLGRVAERDSEALGSLYDRFAPKLMGLLVRILSSRSGAETALQEVFLRLWKEAPSLAQSRGSVAAWLVFMARHEGFRRLRAQRAGVGRLEQDSLRHGQATPEKQADKSLDSRRREHKPRERPTNKYDSQALMFLAASPELWMPQPEDIASVDARLGLLQRAINQMPKPQLGALELAFFDAYTESEIAAQLGEPLGKVTAGLRAAFTFLRHRQHAVLGTWTADI